MGSLGFPIYPLDIKLDCWKTYWLHFTLLLFFLVLLSMFIWQLFPSLQCFSVVLLTDSMPGLSVLLSCPFFHQSVDVDDRLYHSICGSLQLFQSYHGLAASWINILPTQLVHLDGHPCYGRFEVVQYSFYFWKMDRALWVLQSLGCWFI